MSYFCLMSQCPSPLFQGRVRVSFVNDFGAEEAGMDQGGLFKEFLTDLAKDAFHPGSVVPRVQASCGLSLRSCLQVTGSCPRGDLFIVITYH